VKLLFLGHSDSDGTRLPDPQDACSRVIERLLADHGIECQVVHRLLFAGPTAATFLEKQLASEEPDVVVIATSTYGVLIKMVSKRVRERFGVRAGDLAARAERFVARHPGPAGSKRAAVFAEARRVGRRVIGTSGDFSVAGLEDCYRDCFMAIARREDLHGIVVGGAAYTEAVWRVNPGAERLQSLMDTQFEAAAREHRLDWISHQALLGGPAHKLPYYQDDGVHTDARSHRLLAEAVVERILAKR
jgi:lysophospholipase L1-like esterase